VGDLVAIIVLNRNQTGYTRDCLASLRANEYRDTRILVVDNDSSEDSLLNDSLLNVAGEFPEVEFLYLQENRGVAGGRNAGLRQVLAWRPQYVLFLDNDTFVAPDFLSHLVARMRSDPRVGAVQPKIYYETPPNRICSVGGKFYPRISHYRHPGSGRYDSLEFEHASEVDILAGCASLMRAEVFARVGLLDETYSPYCHEDVDWSLRVSQAGFRLMVEPAAKVWHRISSQPRSNPMKLRELAKGHILFLRFHTRRSDLPLSVAWVSFYLLRRFFLPAVGSREWRSLVAVCQGLRDGFRQKPLPIEMIPS